MKVCVMYADGSAIRNPGICGYGVYGYTYDDETVGKSYSIDNVKTLASGFSDHRCDVEVMPINFIEAYGNFDIKDYPANIQTNNLAELTAALKAIEIALELEASRLFIYSDSTYTVNSLENIESIHNRDYRKSDGGFYKSIDTLRNMYIKTQEAKFKNMAISINWIKGHNGFLGNEQADMLAGIASRKSKNKEYLNYLKIRELKDYKAMDKSNKPDLLCYPRLYFNTKPGSHTPGYYFLASYVDTKSDQFYLGKKSSDSIFALLKLKSSCKEVEDVIFKHQAMANRYNKLVRLDVGTLFNKETTRLYNNLGNNIFVEASSAFGYNAISNLKGSILTVDEIPSCLAYKAIDVCNELASVLGPYMRGEDLGRDTVLYDITSALYEEGKKGLKLKPEYINSSIPVPLKDLNISLDFRYNLPDRNIMKRLEDKEVKVLYGRRSMGNMIIFDFTIIDCIDGILITSNRYARRFNEMFLVN